MNAGLLLITISVSKEFTLLIAPLISFFLALILYVIFLTFYLNLHYHCCSLFCHFSI